MSHETLSTKQPILLFTDGEPDDIVALGLLRDCNVRMIIAGESDAPMQAARIAKYAQMLNMDTVIRPGFSSDRIFDAAGQEFTPPLTKVDQCQDAVYGQDLVQLVERFTTFSKESDDPVVIILKPPHELVAAFEEYPDQMRAAMSRVTCYAYGSFNFRQTFVSKHAEEEPKWDPKTRADVLNDFLCSFKRTYIYETYFVGERVAHPDNMPLFYSALQASAHTFSQALSRLISLWNQHIIHELGHSQVADTIRAQIEEHPSQMVLADFGLIAAMRWDNSNLKRAVSLSFTNRGYTTPHFNENRGNLYIYTDLDLGSADKLMAEDIQQL